MKRVYTYYESCPSLCSRDNAHKLIDLWKKQWIKHGYTPVIFHKKRSERNPLYKDLLYALSHVPFAANREHERLRFIRWAAAGWKTDGTIVDIDTMPVSSHCRFEDISSMPIVHGMRHSPCMVSATPYQFDSFVRYCIANIHKFVIKDDTGDYCSERKAWHLYIGSSNVDYRPIVYESDNINANGIMHFTRRSLGIEDYNKKHDAILKYIINFKQWANT